MSDRRSIPGFPGYAITLEGQPWSSRRGQWRPMKRHLFKGYWYVCLVAADGRKVKKAIHAALLEAFVGPCPAGMEACHYPDPTKTNNALSNLRWDTPQENIKDRYRDRPAATRKSCSTCNRSKPVTEFYRDSRVVDGRKAQCKRCHTRTTNEARKRRAA